MRKRENNWGIVSGNIWGKRCRRIFCCAGIAALLGASTAMAQSPVVLAAGTQTEEAGGPGTEKKQTGTIHIRALVKAVEDEKILAESQSEEIYQGEILLNTSVIDTRIVNGETGFQADAADIQAGTVIDADIRAVMTNSLPPQTTAEVIVFGIPEGTVAPEYILTESMEWQQDENWRLVSATGAVYQVPKDCPVISYGMNEFATFRIISKSSKLLVWLDENNQPWRILKLPARW